MDRQTQVQLRYEILTRAGHTPTPEAIAVAAARAAQARAPDDAPTLSKCGFVTFFPALQAGWRGHLGAWQAAVRTAAAVLASSTAKAAETAATDTPK